MIVAAHQPAYMPWLGYLAKIAAADVFVVMDDLQFERQNFQNRNRLKLNHGPAWVTVPLEHGPQNQRICDKRIDNSSSPKQHWQHRTWQTLRTHYGAAPGFRDYADGLKDIFTRPWTSLLDLDLYTLELSMNWLGIRRPVLRSSSFDLVGQK